MPLGTDSILDDPNFGSRQALAERDQLRRDTSKQYVHDKKLERTMRLGYRQAIRNKKFGEALDIMDRAEQSNINFSGITDRASDMAAARKRVDDKRYRVEQHYADGQKAALADRLAQIEEDATSEVDARYGRLQGEYQKLNPLTPEMQAGGFDDFRSRLFSPSLRGPLDDQTRLAFRKELANYGSAYASAGESRLDDFAEVFDRLGLSREQGGSVLKQRAAMEEAGADRARGIREDYYAFNRDAEIRKATAAREEELRLGIRRAGGLTNGESRRLLNRI